MIHAITGRPGAGKSYYAVGLIIEALRRGESCRVLTNLPLKLPSLNEYLHKTWPNESLNVMGRVVLLADEQVREFWRYRGYRLGPRGEIEGPLVVGEVSGEVTVYPEHWPCVYVLDEFHLFFNAREWARTGKAALWYASQHRHLGDTVYWITQHVGNVDKQFRVLTQDYTTLRNLSKERWLGFSMPARMKLEVSLESPDAVSRTICETRYMRYDPARQQCYDTSGGVGLPGGLPPEPSPPRRPSIIWGAVLAVALVVAAAVFVPRMLSAGISAAARGLTSAGKQVGQSVSQVAVTPPPPSQVPGVPLSGAQSGQVRDVPAPPRRTMSWRIGDRVVEAWESDRVARIVTRHPDGTATYRDVPLSNR